MRNYFLDIFVEFRVYCFFFIIVGVVVKKYTFNKLKENIYHDNHDDDDDDVQTQQKELTHYL